MEDGERGHTVSSFDDDLKELATTIARMGGQAESHLAAAVECMERRDSDLAGRVIASDFKVDRLETEVQQQVIRLLALRQPVGGDLRHIVISLKIASDLERIADYAANIAKRVLVLNQLPTPGTGPSLGRLARFAQQMMHDVLDAYMEQDLDKARDVWLRDERLDDLHTGFLHGVIAVMIEDARTITACTHMMFMAKNIERIGDHATNIAESVHFLVNGRMPIHPRPRGASETMQAALVREHETRNERG